jgi:hypothetical protein
LLQDNAADEVVEEDEQTPLMMPVTPHSNTNHTENDSRG